MNSETIDNAAENISLPDKPEETDSKTIEMRDIALA